jgi:deoxyribodipyrimidine photolyase-like uncharacterized protein
MAKKRGYRKFIVVDISAGSNARKLDFRQTETVLITSAEKMGGVFSFDQKFLQQYSAMGYWDTMKAFGSLQGDKVYLEIDPEESQAFRDSVNLDEAKTLLPLEHRLRKNLLSAYMELTIEVLSLEQRRIWSKADLDQAVLEHLEEVQEGLKDFQREDWQVVEKRIRQELKDGSLIQSGVFYHSLAQEFLSGQIREWVVKS